MNKFLKDSIYTSIAFMLQKPVSFVREFVLAGLLGPYYMGLKELIIMLMNYSSYAYIGSLVELYRKTAAHEETEKYVSSLLGFGIILSIIISLGIIFYVLSSEHNYDLTLSFLLLIPIIFFYLLGNVLAYYLNGKAMFINTSTNETLFVIINTMLSIVLGFWIGYIGVILGITIAYFIRFLLFYNYWRMLRIPFTFEWKRIFTLMKDGINLFVNNISENIYMQIDSLICILMLGASSLGIYGVATKINSLIYSVFNSALNPFEQKLISRKDDKRMEDYLYLVLIMSSYVMVYPILVIVVISPFLLKTLLPSFIESGIVIMVLAPSALVNVILTPLRGQLIAKGKERIITISTLIASFINLICNILFIYLGYGLIGICISTSISYFINLILMSYMSKFFTLQSFVKVVLPFFIIIVFMINVNLGLLLLFIFGFYSIYTFWYLGLFDIVEMVVYGKR